MHTVRQTVSVCLHERFQAQADRTPDAVAVALDAQALSYRALDERSSQLARHLLQRGIRREMRVAICVERSLDMVIALLGILKAGAAYVPIDPSYPLERVRFMLDDARAAAVVTQGHLAERVPASATICLDTEASAIASEGTGRLCSAMHADDAAYVIYTSGSSGRPKATVVPHASVCNVVDWMQQAHPLTAEDAVVQRISYAFDGSVCDFYWPLLAGGRLLMLRPDRHDDPDYLARVIDDQRATTLILVPSMLALLLDLPARAHGLGSLRRVFCGGETLPPGLVQRAFARLGPQVRLGNLYGPTETTVFVTAWHCDPADLRAAVPIGRPIDNTQVHVLDPAMRPVEVGATGEIYIGGRCVARCYLNQPALTAERFVPDPFGAPGGRLYRTGDLARGSADGILEYLGRIDDQVKLHGFRIEPREVEAALCRLPGVRDATVIVREDRPGDARLVGYVVAAPGAALSVAALTAELRRDLPAYMVPAALVLLAALPRTPRGKLDRNALPAPDRRRAVAAAYVEPRTALEVLLTSIVAAVIDIAEVGVVDPFFELGLDSLQLARVAHGASRALGIEIGVGALFAHPTVADTIAAVAPDAGTRVRLEREAELVLQLANEPERSLAGEE
jgi:amino acid adenylation domain-containing protein